MEDNEINASEDLVDTQTIENSLDKKRKIAAMSFVHKNNRIYSIDVYEYEFYEDGEIKSIYCNNTINNFGPILPTKEKEFKKFFTIYGIIRYIFPMNKIPIAKGYSSDIIINKINLNVNNYIRSCKLQKELFFEVRLYNE